MRSRRVSTRELKRIILEERMHMGLILEKADDVIKQETEDAETMARRLDLGGIDWNSLITTIVSSGISGILKTVGAAEVATGVGAPVGAVTAGVGLALDGAAFVKASYEGIQAVRASLEFEKRVKELTGEYPNVVLMGFTWDHPISKESLESLKNLPQDEKDRLGLLIARMMQYTKRCIVSLLNAAPDDIASGAMAASLSVMPIEEVIISLSQTVGEVLDVLPWLDDVLRMDNFVSKTLHTILNRLTLVNMGRVASAIGMLDPTKLDRLESAPELSMPERLTVPDLASDVEDEEDEEDDDEDELTDREKMMLSVGSAGVPESGIQAEGFVDIDRWLKLAGIEEVKKKDNKTTDITIDHDHPSEVEAIEDVWAGGQNIHLDTDHTKEATGVSNEESESILLEAARSVFRRR